jgi:hypothetical protein
VQVNGASKQLVVRIRVIELADGVARVAADPLQPVAIGEPAAEDDHVARLAHALDSITRAEAGPGIIDRCATRW